MSLARNIGYTSAGRQDRPFEKMVVRANVRIPDSEAGADEAAQQAAFHAPSAVKSKARKRPTLPMYMAVLILGLAICMIAMGVVARNAQKTSLAKDIDALYTEIEETRKRCTELTEDLARARDSSSICYYAAHTLGMTAVDPSQTVYITAPDTRPNDTNALDVSFAQMMGSNAGR